MKGLLRITTLLFAAVLAAGCAGPGNVVTTPDKPHAVLSTNSSNLARSIYKTHILEIGNDQTFAEQDNITVTPGTYVLRVSPDIRAMARNENVRLDANEVPMFGEIVRELTVDLSAGKRYYIGAKFEGPTLYDWKPIVVRAESLASR